MMGSTMDAAVLQAVAVSIGAAIVCVLFFIDKVLALLVRIKKRWRELLSKGELASQPPQPDDAQSSDD
jgi:hypothetical protein